MKQKHLLGTKARSSSSLSDNLLTNSSDSFLHDIAPHSSYREIIILEITRRPENKKKDVERTSAVLRTVQ